MKFGENPHLFASARKDRALGNSFLAANTKEMDHERDDGEQEE
jgi:hypothetical protein